MPLIVDPSSTCDICLEKYSSKRQCYAVPCGHIFCSQCLSQVNGLACPLCRANMLAAPRVARKLCVDFAPTTSASSSSSHTLSAHQKKQIEDVLDKLLETLNKRTITVQAANGIAQRAQTLLEDLPSNPTQFRSIRIIELLAVRLSIALTDLYEQSSLDRAQRASYETRIQELEKSLRKMNIKRQSSVLKGETSANRVHQSQSSRPHAQGSSSVPQRPQSSSRPLESSQRTTGSKKQPLSARLTTTPALAVPRRL